MKNEPEKTILAHQYLQEPGQELYSAYGVFIKQEFKHLCIVHPFSIEFCDILENVDKTFIKPVYRIKLDFTVYAATSFSNFTSKAGNVYSRLALYISDNQILICSFENASLNVHTSFKINVQSQMKMITLDDYLVCFIYPWRFFVLSAIENDFPGIYFDIDNSIGPTYFSSSKNILYFISQIAPAVYKIDIDKIFESYDQYSPFIPEKIFTLKNQVYSNIFVDNDDIYIFSLRDIIKVRENEKGVTLYALNNTYSECSLAIRFKDLILIFYINGEMHILQDNVVTFYKTLSRAIHGTNINNNYIYVLSSIGFSFIVTEDLSIYLNLHNIHIMSNINLLPKSILQPQEFLIAGSQVLGYITRFGKGYIMIEEKEYFLKYCTGLFRLYNTAILSFKSKTLSIGSQEEISPLPTTFIIECGKSFYVQGTDGKVFFFNKKIKQENKPIKLFKSLKNFILNSPIQNKHSFVIRHNFFGGSYNDSGLLYLYEYDNIHIFKIDHNKKNAFQYLFSEKLPQYISHISAGNENILYVTTYPSDLFVLNVNIDKKEIEIMKSLPYNQTAFNDMIYAFNKYILIGTKSGHLIIYDSQTLEFLFERQISSFLPLKFDQMNKGSKDETIFVFSEFFYLLKFNPEKQTILFWHIKLNSTLFNFGIMLNQKVLLADDESVTLYSLRETSSHYNPHFINGSVFKALPLNDHEYVAFINYAVSFIIKDALDFPKKQEYEFPSLERVISFTIYKNYIIVVGQIADKYPVFSDEGFVYLFDSDDITTELTRIKLPYAVSDVVVLNDIIYFSAGSSILIYKLDENNQFIQLNEIPAKVVSTSLLLRNGYIIALDICKSITIFEPDGESLKVVAVDNHHRIIHACAFINDNELLLSDSDGNIIDAVINKENKTIHYKKTTKINHVFNELISCDFSSVQEYLPKWKSSKIDGNIVIGCSLEGAIVAFSNIHQSSIKQKCVEFIQKGRNQPLFSFIVISFILFILFFFIDFSNRFV